MQTQKTPNPAAQTLAPYPAAANAMGDAIAKLESVITALDALANSTPETKAATQATSAMIEVAMLLRDEVPRRALSTFAGYTSALNAERTALEANLPPNESATKIAEARGRFVKLASEATAAAFGDRAHTLVAAAGNALQRAEDELAAATAKALGPLALKGSIGIDAACQIQALREELKGQRPRVWSDLLRAFIERGETEQERLLTLAMTPIATETLGLPAPKFAQRFGGAVDAREMGAIRGEASAFQAAVEKRRFEQMPPHLETLRRVLSYLQGVWDFCCGYNQAWLSSEEFSMLFLRAGALPPKRGDVHPKWLLRTAEDAIRRQR